MSDFNTFTGKTVDDAINEACRFFSTQRDKLEVEIITGGSTGIFGLVGKKKAQIRAKRRQDPAMAARMLEEEQGRAAQLVVADELAVLLDGMATNCNGDLTEQPVIDHYGVRSFCVNPGGETVGRMELRCIPVSVAKEIIKLLRSKVPR